MVKWHSLFHLDFMKKRESPKDDNLESMFREIKDILLNPEKWDRESVYYIESSSGLLRLTMNSKGEIFIIGNDCKYLTDQAKKLAKLAKKRINITIKVE